ncbi:MAG: SDR family NAD(P)-dependent oxidoreductase [Planctomycetes bacterium]|nr:SDR family NAD(P)-dependent oxidoreductase [Planctomycetota bacterium]
MPNTDGVVLVTGGAGFIGSHLVRALVDQGRRVRVADNLSTGRREHLAEVAARIEFVEADVREEAALEPLLDGVDLVFHEAGDYSVPRSLRDPVAINEVNVSTTVNVLWGAVRRRVARVVVASSCAVYGDATRESEEEELPAASFSPYSVSKAVTELYCRTFAQNFGLPVVCLRYFNVFGPRQNADPEYGAVIPRFIAALLDGTRPVIYGDGKQTRDFVDVEDVVRANLLAGDGRGEPGASYNIAAGRPRTILDVLAAVEAATGKRAEPEFLPPRPGDRRHCAPDVSAAERALGFRAEVDFVEGLRRFVSWRRGS